MGPDPAEGRKRYGVSLPFSARILACLLLATSASVVPAWAESWRVLHGTDPIDGSTRCLMISSELQVDDGQTITPVSLVFTGSALAAVTESNIDLSYPDVGLQVDQQPVIPVDRVHRQTIAVFENSADAIRGQFQRGHTARLKLGFWPTWPQTETVVMEFSLLGFIRAQEALLHCDPGSGAK